MIEIKDTPGQLYHKDELAMWNQSGNWGNEYDKQIQIVFAEYNHLEQELLYSIKVLQRLEVNTLLGEILAPLKYVENVPESQLMKLSFYHTKFGPKKI
jgi:hypothetical protein